MTELVAAILVVAGAAVTLTGAVGLLRMPDFFCRLHGVGVMDTLGPGLLLLGLLMVSGSVVVAFKVILIGALLFLLAPVTSHALANAAHRRGMGQGMGEDVTNPVNHGAGDD